MTLETARTEHKHPNYVAIWGFLVAALLVSVLMGYMKLPVVTLVLIFSVAVVKAFIVVSYYMHLKFEPFFVAVIVVAGLACLYFLFFGLVPDIVFAPTKVAP
jgi:cytochrome c oxidase subunit 4